MEDSVLSTRQFDSASMPEWLLERLSQCRSLPSVPGVVLEILRLGQEDRGGTAEVAAAIMRDPALTAKVLRVANSAAYGGCSHATTVDRAVSMLGINASMSLALGFSFVHGIRGSEKGGFDHRAYWRRSAISAVASRAIGSADGLPLPGDEMFVAGLLQDIGMLVLSQAVPEIYGPIVAASQGDHVKLSQLEWDRLETDHAAVGRWMAEQWKLPEPLQLAIAFSHMHTAADIENAPPLMRCVALGGKIAEVWCVADTRRATAEARRDSISIFEMSPERFDAVLQVVAGDLKGATADLEIEIESQEEIYHLLDLAREALVTLNLRSQQIADEMRSRAETDRLTSLPNRATFDAVLEKEFKRGVERKSPVSILFADIDHFKNVNDTHGHAVGDTVLAWVAGRLHHAIRPADMLARFGGEEFIAVIPNVDANVAKIIAERLRAAVASERCPIREGQTIPITISVGCATMTEQRPFKSATELVEAADRCLYTAKREGRNRVAVLGACGVA